MKAFSMQLRRHLMIKDPKCLEIESTLVDLLIMILSVKKFLQKKNFSTATLKRLNHYKGHKNMLKRELNSFKKSKAFRYLTFLIQLFQISKSASSFYKTSYYNNLYRCFMLGTKKGFRPEYAFQLGLLKPRITENVG